MIGLLTFYWADDYGALLQAYALKYSLEKIGHGKVEVIPYAPVKFTGRYRLFPILSTLKKGEKIKYSFNRSKFHTNMYYLPIFIKRKINMHIFRYHYLSKKLPIRKSSKLSVKKYKSVFIGSDQIWNPDITIDLDSAYIGNIKNKGTCKLIAYAASFGGNNLPEAYRKEFANAIKHNFFTISLREKSAIPFVENLLNRHIIDVLDPTLLLEKHEWVKISKKPSRKKYILYIRTEKNEKMLQCLYALSQKTGKIIVQLAPLGHNDKYGVIENYATVSPTEYIGYFDNADYIITNSFHGVAFSIIFEKQFWAFSHSSRNARLECLLQKLNLGSRLISPDENRELTEIDAKIDWTFVRSALEKEKETSFKFITDALQFDI